jgi:hypothetical protein
MASANFYKIQLFILSSLAFSYLVFLFYIIYQVKTDNSKINDLNKTLYKSTYILKTPKEPPKIPYDVVKKSLPNITSLSDVCGNSAEYLPNTDYIIPDDSLTLLPIDLFRGLVVFLVAGTAFLTAFAVGKIKKLNKLNNENNDGKKMRQFADVLSNKILPMQPTYKSKNNKKQKSKSKSENDSENDDSLLIPDGFYGS